MNDSITTVKQLLKSEWLASDEFTTILETLTTEIAIDGFVVTPPAVIYTHERASAMPSQFPAVELLGLSSQPMGDSSAFQYRHNIDVLWTVAGDDEERVVRMVEALILGTRRLTYRRLLPMPDGTTAPVIPGAENYGPLLSRRHRAQQPLVKGATIRIVVPTFA